MSISEKLITVSENMAKVHEAGNQKGWSDTWDMIQDYGNRTVYNYAFNRWNTSTDRFYPKYDIKPVLAEWFARDVRGTKTIDLVERLNECGVVMDFSQCKNVNYLFYNSIFYHIPELDLRMASTTVQNLLFGNRVVTVDKLILTDDGSQSLAGTFDYASSLKNIVIEGVIGANSKGVGFDTKWSKKLSRASIISLVNALATSDILTQTSLTATFSVTAVNNAFETAEGLADGSESTEWAELIATRPNWTIILSEV